MAKINARSSLSSVSQRVFQPEMIPFDDYMSRLFESYSSSCSGNLTKVGWRSFLESRHAELRECYFDNIVTPFADKVFTSYSRRLARSQPVPTQMTLDDTVIHLPPVLISAESSAHKNHRVYSTLQDSTLKNLRYHLDYMKAQIVEKQKYLSSLEDAYSALFKAVRGDLSARLSNVISLFSAK